MSNTLSVRLSEDLAEWLTETARKTGVSQSTIIREQLEKARVEETKSFLRLAGAVSRPRDLSTRKGFSKR